MDSGSGSAGAGGRYGGFGILKTTELSVTAGEGGGDVVLGERDVESSRGWKGGDVDVDVGGGKVDGGGFGRRRSSARPFGQVPSP